MSLRPARRCDLAGFDAGASCANVAGVRMSRESNTLHTLDRKMGNLTVERLPNFCDMTGFLQGRAVRMRLIDLTNNKIGGKAMAEIEKAGRQVVRVAKTR